MKTNEVLKLFDKELLDKIYHFSYHRCNTSVEAEDLCSEIVLDREYADELAKIQNEFVDGMADVIEDIAKELSVYMKKHIPEHLLNEYAVYTRLLAGSELLPAMIEECIREDLLLAPENRIGAEGVLMIVEKK